MASREDPQDLNSTEEASATPEEGSISFDDLLNMTAEPVADPVEEAREGAEASPETEEREESTLEEKIEKAKQTAYDAAYTSYEILSDQDAAAARLNEIEHTDPNKRTPEEQEFMSVASNILPAERRQGHGDPSIGPSWQQITFDFPQFTRRMLKQGEGSVDAPSQYIPAVIDAVESYRPLIEKDKRPEEQAATEEQALLALQKSVEGFTKAAFENDDIEVVLQGLEYLDALDDPENLKKIKEKMEKLKSSDTPEDRERLQKAGTMLREIRQRKTEKPDVSAPEELTEGTAVSSTEKDDSLENNIEQEKAERSLELAESHLSRLEQNLEQAKIDIQRVEGMAAGSREQYDAAFEM